ncbi:MAG: hypothetical protein H0V24_09755 [Chloroflexia bacterium]|nr:hypothetical protein [Chloroflexia bacterium]
MAGQWGDRAVSGGEWADGMAETDRASDERRRRLELLGARAERLRAVAVAADRASHQIDETVLTLEPRVAPRQEAATALTILVNLSGAVQRELVSGLNQLESGELEPPSAADE